MKRLIPIIVLLSCLAINAQAQNQTTPNETPTMTSTPLPTPAPVPVPTAKKPSGMFILSDEQKIIYLAKVQKGDTDATITRDSGNTKIRGTFKKDGTFEIAIVYYPGKTYIINGVYVAKDKGYQETYYSLRAAVDELEEMLAIKDDEVVHNLIQEKITPYEQDYCGAIIEKVDGVVKMQLFGKKGKFLASVPLGKDEKLALK